MKRLWRQNYPCGRLRQRCFYSLQSLDLIQMRNYPGLNLEKLHGMIEPNTGEQLYSIRSTIACLLKGPTIVLTSLHTQHDKAYK